MKNHKSGFVTILGNPNVGKSTLINALVGEQLSVINKKAQTTRHRILGLINDKNYQIVLSDTPGIIKPNYGLQDSMMDFVKGAIIDSDFLIYMVQINQKNVKDDVIFSKIKSAEIPKILLINKIDKGDQDKLNETIDFWKEKLPNTNIYPISALTGFSVKELINVIVENLPTSPPYFPKDQFTDKPERFFVNEIVRGEILRLYSKEIPYSVEVNTISFIRKNKIIHISCEIYVEKQTQKGILIGHKGEALKKVGIRSRKKLQTFFEKKINIEIFVKVLKNWRNNKNYLKKFGYNN